MRGKSTIGALAASLLDKGTLQKNRQQLRDSYDRLKARVNVSGNESSATVSIVNSAPTSLETSWGAYVDQLLVGSNAAATGTANWAMVITYASSASFGGLCIDDTVTAATCPSRTPQRPATQRRSQAPHVECVDEDIRGPRVES